jgi:flavin-binding protein dodecin
LLKPRVGNASGARGGPAIGCGHPTVGARVHHRTDRGGFRAQSRRHRPRTGADLDHQPRKGKTMTVARITEISSVSSVSFQDAIIQGVERANKTLKNVKGAWIKDQEVTIDNGKITGYKVILKVTFILSD